MGAGQLRALDGCKGSRGGGEGEGCAEVVAGDGERSPSTTADSPSSSSAAEPARVGHRQAGALSAAPVGDQVAVAVHQVWTLTLPPATASTVPVRAMSKVRSKTVFAAHETAM